MFIRYFSFYIFLCILLNASYAVAGGSGSKSNGKSKSKSSSGALPTSDTTRLPSTPRESVPKSPRKLSAHWKPQMGDDFKALSNVRVTCDHGYHHQALKIGGFYPNGDIATDTGKRVPLQEFLADWAKVEPKNELHDKRVHDENGRAGKVRGFYEDGSFLLSAQEDRSKMSYFWRAREAHVFLDSMPELCDEHGCPMSTLQCGHQVCEECFPPTNPVACVSCLASKVSTGQKLSAHECI